jgi:hypothetical protein
MVTGAEPADSALLRRMSWGSFVTMATVTGTLALACATPFAALAALAALFLPRRDAFVLIGMNWVASEAIGFGFMNYPHTWDCLRGGIEMGVAAMGCTGAVMLLWPALRKLAFPLAAVGAFAAAFVVYEGLLFLTSIGHHDGDDSLSILMYLLYLNGWAFAGLLLLQGMAEALGVAVPRVIRQPRARLSSAA